MATTGFFASHTDNKYKITYEDLENLSLRKQKNIIIARATERKKNLLKNKFENRSFANNDMSFKADDTMAPEFVTKKSNQHFSIGTSGNQD